MNYNYSFPYDQELIDELKSTLNECRFRFLLADSHFIILKDKEDKAFFHTNNAYCNEAFIIILANLGTEFSPVGDEEFRKILLSNPGKVIGKDRLEQFQVSE